MNTRKKSMVGLLSRTLCHVVAIATLAMGMSMLATSVVKAHHTPGHGGGGGSGGGPGGPGGPGPGPSPVPFSGCGTVVSGVECNLFHADAGGLYVVPGLGSSGGVVISLDGEPAASSGEYQPGDRIHVEGNIDAFCITICQQGNGCINNAVITECEEPDPAADEFYSATNLLHLLSNWGACVENTDGCAWDLTYDGVVDVSDVIELMRIR